MPARRGKRNKKRALSSDDEDNGDDDAVDFALPPQIVNINVLLYTPCHILMVALRAKYIHAPLTDDWIHHVPACVTQTVNKLDRGLAKTFPPFYCVCVGQYQIECLTRSRHNSPDLLLYRDAMCVLITMLRSNPSHYATEMDRLLFHAPSEAEFRRDSAFNAVMAFIDRHELTTIFSRENPMCSTKEATLITKLRHFLTITVHLGDCPSNTNRSYLHTNVDQQPTPPRVGDNRSVVADKCPNAPDAISKNRVEGTTTRVENKEDSNQPDQFKMGSDDVVFATHNLPATSVWEVDLHHFVQACYSLDRNCSYNLNLLKDVEGKFRDAYQAVLRHNSKCSGDLRCVLNSLFYMIENDRVHHYGHSLIRGNQCSYLSQLMASFRRNNASLDMRCPDYAPAYFVIPRLRVTWQSIHQLLPLAQVRTVTTPMCGIGTGKVITMMPGTTDCTKDHRGQRPMYLYSSVPSSSRIPANYTDSTVPKDPAEEVSAHSQTPTDDVLSDGNDSVYDITQQATLDEHKNNSTHTQVSSTNQPDHNTGLRRSPRFITDPDVHQFAETNTITDFILPPLPTADLSTAGSTDFSSERYPPFTGNLPFTPRTDDDDSYSYFGGNPF